MLKEFVMAGACIAAVSSTATGQAPAVTVDRGPEIVVSGRGEATVPSDRAVVSVAIRTQARNASEAAASNTEKVAAIQARVARVGMGAATVTTSSYSVQPVYRYSEEREQIFTGNYVAVHTLTVHIPDVRLVGPLIDAILESGATQIIGTSFEALNLDEARGAALRAAVGQAHRDASIMAEAVGGRLGELVHLSTDPERTSTPGVRLEALMIGGGSTQMTPTAQVITATVVGRWRFRPGS